jgi:DNA polymerase-3 subunit epsilon
MPSSFLALDVETANANISSICQSAVVRFEVGKAVNIWHSLVNPGEPFAALNVAIHGIDAGTVQDAPDFPGVMFSNIRPALQRMGHANQGSVGS